MLSSVRHIAIFFCAATLPFFALCQQTKFSVTHYGEMNGLQSNVINAMMQDSRGYLWFGTNDGLFRFDGYNFKLFKKSPAATDSSTGTAVTQLAEDRNGKIWMGTLKDGLTYYDPATGEFRSYPVKNIDSTSRLIRSITMIFIDNENNIWAGLYQKGLLRLNQSTGKFTHFNVITDTNTYYSNEFRELYNYVNDMHDKGAGFYWLATRDGLYNFNSRTGDMQPVRAMPLEKDILRNDSYTSMADDKNGLWLGAWAGGLTYLDFTTGKWSNYKFDLHHTNVATINIITDLKPKNENELWIASTDRGFDSFNKTTHKFTFYSNDASPHALLPGKYCWGVMQDRQKNLWLSTAGGLAKVRQTEPRFQFVPVQVTRTDNGPFFEISSMLEDKKGKRLFTGTSFADGLHIQDVSTKKWSALSFPVKANEENILMVNSLFQDSKEVIWVLTRDYLYQFDPLDANLRPLPQPPGYMGDLRSNDFNKIDEDHKGRIWISSGRNGVFCYDPLTKTYKHFFKKAAGSGALPSNVIAGLAIDKKGRIWVGGKGCFGYFDDTGMKFNNLDEFATPSAFNSDNRVYTLYTDRTGDIWAGTDAGLYHYNANSIIPSLKKIYHPANGMRGDIVYKICEDSTGNIWCITNSAVCKVNKQNGNIVSFGRLDGIDNITTLRGLFLFRNNKMALLAQGGYYIFDPSSLLEKSAAVPLAVTSFKIDDKEQFFENTLAAQQMVVVPANSNVISFEYAALDFDRPDKQQYAYMLEGFDKDWIMAGQRRYASYTNIPGDDYVFKVKATNTSENWNTPVFSIPIHVKQPFYKTWWFIIVAVAIIVVSLDTFYRFKLAKQQEILGLETKAQTLQKEKALVMYESLRQQLNPHFLFNSLTSLSSLIRYDQKKAGDFLDGLSKIYRYILKSRHNETVTLAEEIKFVQTFITLQQTRFDRGLMVNINIDEKYENCKIAPVTLQNLIENAIKHNIIDEESPLTLDIYTEKGYLVVKNNLQKKTFVETSNKQGLLNLKSLYEYLSRNPIIIEEDEQYFFVKIPMI